MGAAFFLAVFVFVFASRMFVIVQTGTEVVVEKLGQFNKVLTPGFHFILPIYSKKYVTWHRTEETRVGTRSSIQKVRHVFAEIPVVEQVHDLPEFRSSTKDRIDVFVNGLVFYKIVDVKKAVYNINDLYSAIESLVETAIRDYTSTASLEEVFVSRDKLMACVVNYLNDCEEKWGVRIIRFEIQEINCSPEVRKATEAAVLKKRQAEARLTMAEANKQAQLLEAQAQNEVNSSNQQATAQLELEKAETKKQLNNINNQIALETTEVEMKVLQMEQAQKAQNIIAQAEAEAEGMKKILAVTGIAEEYLRHRNQLAAWTEMANNPNNKIVLPYNSVQLLGAQSLMHSLANTDPKHE